MGIISDIQVVIEADKVESFHLPIDDQDRYREKYNNENIRRTPYFCDLISHKYFNSI
jgi:hypothetical protein